MQTLQNISTKELRDNLAEVLEKVAIGGQSFVVSKFGRKKAMLVPVDKADEVERKGKRDLRLLTAFGVWKNRKDITDSAAWVANLRRTQSLRIRD